MKNKPTEDRFAMLQLAAVICFFVITIFFYTPSGLFIGNIDEFPVDYIEAFPIIAVVAVAVGLFLAVVGLALRKNKRAFYLYVDLLFGITLAAYIQGNFLNGNLPQLDGREYDWNGNMKAIVTSTSVWILCLVIPHVVRACFQKIQPKIVIGGCGLLSAMQMVALIVMLIGTERTVDNTIAATKKDEFLLSSKKNVIVFVIDTLDAQWAENYIIDDPQYKDLLSDFTYYDNVVGGGAPTVLGMPALLTGQLYDLSQSLDEFYRSAYASSSLFKDLKESDFLVHLYTGQEIINHIDYEHIDNIFMNTWGISSPARFAKLLFRFTAYYLSPYILKENLVFETSAFSSCYSLADQEQSYYFDDPQFFNDFKETGISVTEYHNVFVLYHLVGAHGPYTMNENAERVAESSLEQQIHGSMRIIGDFIAEMKNKNLYENSTIIVVADHGGVSLYQNPALFVKFPNVRKEFSINSDPLTFSEVRATFVSDFLEDYEASYGKDLRDYSQEDLSDWRNLTADSILRLNIYPDEERSSLRYFRFLIGNPARDDSLVRPLESRIFYTLGTIIRFPSADLNILFSGLSQMEDNGIWTDGEKLEMPLTIEDYSEGDLVFSISYSTFDGDQHVVIYADEQLVADYTANGEEEKEIEIPAACIGGGNLDLRFEFPDAHSPASVGQSEDSRELALKFHSMCLTEKP